MNADLLRQHVSLGFCCDCLAVKLAQLPKDVRNAAQLLILQPGFSMVRRVCYSCRRTQDILAFDARGEGAPAPPTDKVQCGLCRTTILPSAGKVTMEGVTYHAGCWDRKARATKRL
jgi:hypothetical protein